MILHRIIVFALVFLSNTFFAQSVFDKYENQEDINAIIVNKKMFSLLSNVNSNDKETQQYINLIKKLDDLKVFITSSDKKSSALKLEADNYSKTAGLNELMRFNENGKNVKIYTKPGASESEVKELLLFMDGVGKEESVLMCITGIIDLNEISVLTDKMKLPGGSELKKLSKK
jgi:soluble P-type ATPase